MTGTSRSTLVSLKWIIAGLMLALISCGGSEATSPSAGSGGGPVTSQSGGAITGRLVFPADNPWNQDVSGLPADPASDAMVASCGAAAALHPDFGTVWNGAPNGIP